MAGEQKPSSNLLEQFILLAKGTRATSLPVVLCSLSFCQAGPKLEAVYPAPRDDCGGGSSLSEEGALLLQPHVPQYPQWCKCL
ncbi:COP9 (constitutive photomorphogenic) homolog, subunit 7b (Arabidopsis thaliana), isoform CRA_c [Mus musculus]|nr:COP9 (constitutive photomorphogenic) homolog, subunit 7b (Arabidopsis thaliana), isoform CRA_c [Mus musculus]